MRDGQADIPGIGQGREMAEDRTAVEPETIKDIPAEMVMAGGEIVHES